MKLLPKVGVGLCACLWGLSVFHTQAQVIPLGSEWQFFKGTGEPSPANPAEWRARPFDDSNWELGVAPFSYGEAGFSGTDLTGMQGQYTTLFLRRDFSVLNPAAIRALQLHAFYDDGFVVWINGVRVAAVNTSASDADLSHSSVAATTIEPTEVTLDLTAPAGYLVPGQNTISVLVLNATLSSSDLVFDAELTSTEIVSPAPFISGVLPESGPINGLTEVTVTFSEPVTGVRAGDFLVNGVPVEAVTGSGITYTFSFPQPAFGPVDISWGPLHMITSLDTPARRFDAGAPGSTWEYQLIAPDGPKLAGVIPIPGILLRRLGAVEVSFDTPVTGVDAADLRMNGIAASQVEGVGAGPYLFKFPQEAAAGAAIITWAANPGIESESAFPVPFHGSSWQYQVDPAQPVAAVVINEIMAENQTSAKDEEGDAEDWIELYNRGSLPVNLGGWSLSVDRDEAGQWVFPPRMLQPGQYLLVWASGKDRRDSAGALHTNFKLNPNGDTLRLFGAELPRVVIDELAYPEQAPNNSYGRQGQGGEWAFLAQPTPNAVNGVDTLAGKVEEVHFSVQRGFFNAPFALTLACPTQGAEIRYTLDGGTPNATNAIVYTNAINITATRIVRAAAFAPGKLPSRVKSHTYLMNLPSNRRLLPVLSLNTDTNYLYGRTGVMEYNPRNTTKHGVAWERPVSVELISPEDNGGFQLDAGLRVAGGDYIRGRYNYRTTTPPEGKYSFRLYFRGDYGPGRLKYRFFPGSTVDSFNTLHLRAGMNDPTNPFIKDEFVRRLSLDVGIPACHGTLVHLFLNGVYKGLYNPCERVDDDFLQAYHGGGGLWDVIGPNNQAIRGDLTAWNQLRTAVRKDLTVAANYRAVEARMDLSNFIDYLLPLLWADNDDWPHNNTRAAREKVPGAPFRFYPWDAEFAFTGHPVSYDTIANTLSSLSPPWGTTDYQAMFNSLKKSPEFRLLFADRVHRAFFNNGPLTDARMRARYDELKAQAAPSIAGFNNLISSWISGRRRYITNAFASAGFLASANAPSPGQLGGRVPAGYRLILKNVSGKIYYTSDGTDPRVAFTGAASPGAAVYTQPILISSPLHLMARSLDATNWSALVDLEFQVSEVGIPVRITEIMYNPPGGESFEYIELMNTGGLPVDVSGFSFSGISFRFPANSPVLAPGERMVLANNGRPVDFQTRYPKLAVAGWFSGSLDNGGERITLHDADGRTVTSVNYRDTYPWPVAADGKGAALEAVDPPGDPDDPANWMATAPGGTPGEPATPALGPTIRINEVYAGPGTDWLELFNSGETTVDLQGWSLSDNAKPRQFVFNTTTPIQPGGFLKVDCDPIATSPGNIAPFGLDRSGETVSLYDTQTNRVHALSFGPMVDGATVGYVGERIVLCDPTPGGPNEAAQSGFLGDIRINEFLANPESGDDWLELHNIGAKAVALEGAFVATSNALARIASKAFIPAGGFLVFNADENSGFNHLNLKLPAAGGSITLLSPQGDELDRVTYNAQAVGITTGRLPDGLGDFRQLPYSPTPGTSNYLAELGTRIRFSEVMARADAGPDWVEIENISTELISLAGFTLGLNDPGASLVRLPFSAQAELPAGQRMVLFFGPLRSSSAPLNSQLFAEYVRGLSDAGSELTLRDGHDRIIDRLQYGAQLPGRSIGRIDQRWALLGQPSPGEANGAAAPLDPGTDLRLNEWLASGSATNEFVELYNPARLPVDLSNWVLTDDPSLYGATNKRITALTFIDSAAFLRFRTDGHPEEGFDHTAFRLDKLGETIRLMNPTGAIIDTVNFGVQAYAVSEGRYPDGAAEIVSFPGSATPGASNVLPSIDSDGDGIDDDWEMTHGLDPHRAADAQEDADGDGMTNSAEFRSGTDPRNPTSLLNLRVSRGTGEAPSLFFRAQPGKSYRLEYIDHLGTGEWRPLQDVPAMSTAHDELLRDSLSTASTRFYRLVLINAR